MSNGVICPCPSAAKTNIGKSITYTAIFSLSLQRASSKSASSCATAPRPRHPGTCAARNASASRSSSSDASCLHAPRHDTAQPPRFRQSSPRGYPPRRATALPADTPACPQALCASRSTPLHDGRAPLSLIIWIPNCTPASPKTSHTCLPPPPRAKTQSAYALIQG